MGNGQSTQAQRRSSNRLSKPKSSASAHLSSLKLGLQSRRGSQANVIWHSVGSEEAAVDHAARSESLGWKPPRILRSRSTPPQQLKSDTNTEIDTEYLETLSRRPSTSSQVPDVGIDALQSCGLTRRLGSLPGRTSLQYPSISQHYNRLSLVAEVGSPRAHPPQQMQPADGEEVEDARLSSTLARTTSDTHLYAPMRMGSLLQHGVATRGSWVENDWRSSPRMERSMSFEGSGQNHYYYGGEAIQSPLFTVDSITPIIGDHNRGPRAVTPSGLEYGHIGAFKLGSLRITNGAASPVPSDKATTRDGEEDSIVSSKRASSPAPHDRHTTQGDEEGSVVPAERPTSPALSDQPTTRDDEENSVVSSERPASPLSCPGDADDRSDTPIQDMARAPRATRSGSPLWQGEPVLKIAELKKLTIDAACLEPLSIDAQWLVPDLSLFNFEISDPKSMVIGDDHIPVVVSLPPFQSSPPASPKLQATSKNMAADDELFDPEPGTSQEPDLRVHKSFDSGFQDVGISIEAKMGDSKGLELGSLAKSDSGYSSNASLRSFRQNPLTVPAKEAHPTPQKEPTSRAAPDTCSIASTKPDLAATNTTSDSTTISNTSGHPAISIHDDVSNSTSQGKRSVPSAPRKPDLSKRPSPPPFKLSLATNDVKTGTFSSAQNSVVRPSSRRSTLDVKGDYITSKFNTGPSRTSKERAVSHSHSRSDGSVSVITSRWRSRSKSRSPQASPPVFTIQAFPSPSEQQNIPTVPKEASMRLEERVDSFPLACFPNTKAGDPRLRRAVSRETLCTIFSVGSAEVREEAAMKRLLGALPSVPVYSPIWEHSSPALGRSDKNNIHVSPLHTPKITASTSTSTPTKAASHPPGIEKPKLQQLPGRQSRYSMGPSTGRKSLYDAGRSLVAQKKVKAISTKQETEVTARFGRPGVIERKPVPTQQTNSYDSLSSQKSSSINDPPPTSGPIPFRNRDGLWKRPSSALPAQRSSSNLARDADEAHPSTPQREHMGDPPLERAGNQTQNSTQMIGYATPEPTTTQSQPQQSAHAPAQRSVSNARGSQQPFWEGQNTEPPQARSGSVGPQQQRPKSSRQSAPPQPYASGPQQQRPRSSRQSAPPRPYALGPRQSIEPQPSQGTISGLRVPKYRSEDAQRRLPGGSYSHTYGSHASRQENKASPHTPHTEGDYYANEEEPINSNLPERIHKRSCSTSDMLVLDRYAGGLAFGYEPSIVGSAGTQSNGYSRPMEDIPKSERKNHLSGVDLRDVPILLTR